MVSLRSLTERKVVQWGIAYAAGAWLFLEVVSLLSDTYGWPAAVMRALPVLLVVGLLAAVVLAWFHGEKGAQRVSGVEIAMLAGILVIAGGVVALVGADATSGAQEAAPTVDSALSADAAVAEQGSIAVLPFADMSPENDHEYFSDGIAEELLNVLAQLPELRVASRTSAFSFKGTNVAIDSIGRALNVRHVLEGSVRKAGDQVRITAQLIDVSTGYHLWSETYDRTLSDIFAVQDEISREIVDQLQITLSGDRGQGRFAEEETRDPEAHVLLLRAKHFYNQNTREGFEQAEPLLKQAIALDSTYARAHAALAGVYYSQAYNRYGPVERYMQQAREAVTRALELDPDLAEVHMVSSAIEHRSGDLREAETSLARAVELSPGSASAHSRRAWVLMGLGRQEEAIRAAERAAELDPVSFAAQGNLGGMYAYGGEYERAARAFEAALALQPDHPLVLANLVFVYVPLGRHEEAIRAAERAREQAPQDQFTLAALAYALARADRHAEAEAVLRTLEALPEPSPYLRATVHAGLGETDSVFVLLEQAVAEKDGFTDLRVDPVFDPYRADPRMDRLLERLNLPAESR